MGTKKLKTNLKPNYQHFDYIALFELPNEEKDDYNEDIVVKVRNYQSSFDYENTQEALVRVYDHDKLVLTLVDDGNGIHSQSPSYLNYSDWVYLTCALRAYDSQYRFARKMKVIKL